MALKVDIECIPRARVRSILSRLRISSSCWCAREKKERATGRSACAYNSTYTEEKQRREKRLVTTNENARLKTPKCVMCMYIMMWWQMMSEWHLAPCSRPWLFALNFRYIRISLYNAENWSMTSVGARLIKLDCARATSPSPFSIYRASREACVFSQRKLAAPRPIPLIKLLFVLFLFSYRFIVIFRFFFRKNLSSL